VCKKCLAASIAAVRRQRPHTPGTGRTVSADHAAAPESSDPVFPTRSSQRQCSSARAAQREIEERPLE